MGQIRRVSVETVFVNTRYIIESSFRESINKLVDDRNDMQRLLASKVVTAIHTKRKDSHSKRHLEILKDGPDDFVWVVVELGGVFKNFMVRVALDYKTLRIGELKVPSREDFKRYLKALAKSRAALGERGIVPLKGSGNSDEFRVEVDGNILAYLELAFGLSFQKAEKVLLPFKNDDLVPLTEENQALFGEHRIARLMDLRWKSFAISTDFDVPLYFVFNKIKSNGKPLYHLILVGVASEELIDSAGNE